MTMKKIKKILSMLSAVALCALLPNTNVLTVSAAEPTTYYLKYVDNNDEWRFQLESWKDDGTGRELYYMYESIKDGDAVVIDSNGYGETATLEFSKRLGNLTVVRDSKATISAPGIDLCFVLEGSSLAVTGDVKEATLYDRVNVSFHSNVGTLTLIDSYGQANGTTNVGGTVSHALRKTGTEYIYYDVYNVAQGKLVIEDGELMTDSAHYSTTPSATPNSNTQTSTSQSTSSNEYDEVPKTGESNAVVWLFGIAGICLLGKRALKRV